MSAPDYATEIAQLEALLNGATKSVSTDGLHADFDLDRAEKRLAELRRLAGDLTLVKPRHSTLNLNGAF